MAKFRIEGSKFSEPVCIVIEADNIELAVEQAESRDISVTTAKSIQQSDCYIPNAGVYPLCVGKDDSCKACGLYEYMVEDNWL